MSEASSSVGERCEAAPEPPSGRVLRVKEGYNPNSSSIGTAIPTYLAFAAGSGAVAVLLLHLRGAVAALLRRRATEAGPRDAVRPADRDDEDEDRRATD
ncbi:MAG: hypothetical protein JRI23_21930 [Deltaproteobacteria bacterium]|jgi:hypothetical protein|nr:hypothetical protein [Deltaproteobacteria bacterium]MBW2534618.1 hypothetical protein [Deltaproteobacteria bacterium]